MTNLKTTMKKVIRHGRILESLENKGIHTETRTNIDRISNTRWNHGRLIDGTLHQTRRFEVGGNTFHVKHILKAAGFRWDAGRKVWWAPRSKVDTAELGATILRELA